MVFRVKTILHKLHRTLIPTLFIGMYKFRGTKFKGDLFSLTLPWDPHVAILSPCQIACVLDDIRQSTHCERNNSSLKFLLIDSISRN